MTIVTQTLGFLGDGPPVAPKEEAELIRSWLLGFHKIPATVAVATTPYFNLPAPDLRRIDKPVANTVNYLFGMQGVIQGRTAYLIDDQGMVLKVERLARENEEMWTMMLGVVMGRKKITRDERNSWIQVCVRL
jgi:hypothetical protein